MPIVKKKLVPIPDRRSETTIIKNIIAALKRYSNKYGSLYVGISVDPKKRLAQHNKAILSGSGNVIADLPWPQCNIIFETTSDDKVRKIERALIDWVLKDQGVSKKFWNDRAGGGGRPPKPGKAAFVYVLLDPLPTRWDTD